MTALFIGLLIVVVLGAPQHGEAQSAGVYQSYLPAVVGPYQPIGLQLFASGLDQPTAIANIGDTRLFVNERPGRVRIVEADGTVAAEPFLDISGQVETENWEQGLLGLVFSPDYLTSGYFYVYYSALGTGDMFAPSRLSRFQVDPDNPNQALPGSEEILLTVPQAARIHHGGDLHFGPDGYLYVSVGDSGRMADAQNLGSLRGSLLRLDVGVNQPLPAGELYAVPPDNPFVDVDGARGEIWAMGLRNPWRFSFDGAGKLYIGDVGASSWEEVNVQARDSAGGQNYGWPCTEGLAEGTTPEPCMPDSEITFPVFAYTHFPGRCSITGGQVYSGPAFPAMEGIYFFADLCDGTFWGLPTNNKLETAREFGRFPDLWPSAFGQDASGEMYVAAHIQGALYRLVPSTFEMGP